MAGGLILSSQTLRGIPIPIRAEAAASAGFTAIGAHHEDLERLRANGTRIDGLREAVEATGMTVVEIGFLNQWAGPESLAEVERQALFDLARTLGAKRISAGLYSGPEPAQIAQRFGTLCRAAASAGLRVSLEFFPFGALPDAASAWEVIARAGEPNADLLFDAWHWHRGGGDPAVLALIPPGAIGSLQVSDAGATAARDVGEESRHGRLLPGTGVIDLTGLLRSLDAAGHHPSIAVEVLSDELGALDPQRVASLAAAATRQVLETARWQE
jgi:sugar phosphate isomerase/epimerase